LNYGTRDAGGIAPRHTPLAWDCVMGTRIYEQVCNPWSPPPVEPVSNIQLPSRAGIVATEILLQVVMVFAGDPARIKVASPSLFAFAHTRAFTAGKSRKIA